MSNPVYRDASAPIPERVKDLLDRMTLEEKVGQMMQLPANEEENRNKLEEWHVGSFLHCSGDMPRQMQERALKTRLGIPLLFGIDAIHGHCFENQATVFPTQLALSCSWNLELTRSMGQVTAKEVRACGLHWTFSPILCVGRDTRWGRINETFGEDPWLIGEMATALIQGYQGDNLDSDESIMACAKHYVGYGEAIGGRDSYEAKISKRELLSLFLPPFEKAVKKGKVATLMAGYQAIDGLPCSADSWLMKEVPKQQWNMQGFIVTDWDNIGSLHTKQNVAENYVEASFLGLDAGNDMIMNTPEFYHSAIELVKQGRIDESCVDDAIRPILTFKFELGLFENLRLPSTENKDITLGHEAHWQKALEASRQSITLLKNDNDTLPLDSKKLQRLVLVGENADDVIAQLGDWSFGSMQAKAEGDTMHREDTTTLHDALSAASETSGFDYDYITGASPTNDNLNEIEKAVNAAQDADVVIACVGDTLSQHGEYHDRSNLDLSGQQQALLEAMKSVGKPLIVVFMASKPLAISWCKENADALICAFNPGSKGGQALSEIIFGECNPTGKLTISFPYSAGQLPVHYNKYEGWHAMLSPQLDEQERYIDLPEDPLFSFGEGISYTSYSYHNLQVLTPVLTQGTPLEVSIDIKNTGKIDGDEIIQLYIRDLYSSVTTPIKNLRAFKRVHLTAGEQKTINLKVEFDDLALINKSLERVVEPGEFEVMVGASSKDIDLQKARFSVE